MSKNDIIYQESTFSLMVLNVLSKQWSNTSFKKYKPYHFSIFAVLAYLTSHNSDVLLLTQKINKTKQSYSAFDEF